MITLLKQDSFSKALMLVGLETDTKPTEYFTFKGAVLPIRNGSTFYEADTATFYIYDGDSDTWIKQSGGGGYPEPTGTVQITQNGVGIDVKDYAEADVAVPNTYGVSDEGKVVDNGALVSQTSKNINADGTYDTTKNNEVVVAVPQPDSAPLRAIIAGNNQTVIPEYVIPSDITSIKKGCMQSADMEIISGSGITSIEANAFIGNTTIKSLSFPNCTTIGEAIASGCTNLESIAFQELQTMTGTNGAFKNCSKLTEVSLPKLATVNTKECFSNCGGLESISAPLLESVGDSFLNGATHLISVYLPELTTVGNNFIYNCKNLTSISLPKLRTAGNALFYWCAKLADVSLPALETIGENFFSGSGGQNYAIKTIDLPVCGSIGRYSFSCTNLESLILRKTDSICVLGGAFTSGDPFTNNNAYIYVPQALISTYQGASNWVVASSRFRALEDYTVDGTTTGALDPSKI